MFETNFDNLKHHLKEELKIEDNAIIWLHIGLKGLGKIRENNINVITDCFESALNSGSLIIPTFTYSWCKNEIFENKKTECKEVGFYNNLAWRDKRFQRTKNPNFSVAIMDNSSNQEVYKKLIKPNTVNTCFGEGSIFDEIRKLSENLPSYIMLLGGAHDDVIFRTTFLHYIEEKISVPYRYKKKFYSPIDSSQYITQYVRYLSSDEYNSINENEINYNYKFPIKALYNKLGIDLEKDKLLIKKKFGYSLTRCVRIKEFCDWLYRKIIDDKNFLLK